MAEHDSNRGPDKGEAYGVAAVAQVLGGMDFPASKQEILEHTKGHEEISWTKDQKVNLRVIFDRIDQEQFDSPVDVVKQVSDKVESGEQAAGGESGGSSGSR